MPNYRRFRLLGGTYFFTINLLNRRSDLLVTHIDALFHISPLGGGRCVSVELG